MMNNESDTRTFDCDTASSHFDADNYTESDLLSFDFLESEQSFILICSFTDIENLLESKVTGNKDYKIHNGKPYNCQFRRLTFSGVTGVREYDVLLKFRTEYGTGHYHRSERKHGGVVQGVHVQPSGTSCEITFYFGTFGTLWLAFSRMTVESIFTAEHRGGDGVWKYTDVDTLITKDFYSPFG